MKEKTSKECNKCALCGCRIKSKGRYAEQTKEGRSHLSRHHFVAERFFGRSATRKGKSPREPIFKNCPWAGVEGKSEVFCYECHEELLHNPVLLPEDIARFAKLVERRGLNESKKTASKSKIRRRIELLHEAIEEGIKALLVAEK